MLMLIIALVVASTTFPVNKFPIPSEGPFRGEHAAHISQEIMCLLLAGPFVDTLVLLFSTVDAAG